MLSLRPYLSHRRREAIDNVISVWQAKRDSDSLKRDAVEQAAQAYLNKEGSLRIVANRFGTSYENVRRRLRRMDEEDGP